MEKTPAEAPIYSFGEYELDTRLHELRRARERLHIEPQVFDVLAHLFACRDRVVTKEELLDRVWGHRYVAPTTLNSRIKHARQAVGDDGATQRVIRTIHGLGFRCVASVEERATSTSATTSPLEQHIQFCTAPDGVNIAYATSGAGPPLVKPANWLTHLEYDWESPVWRHWLRELSREQTLVRYDERGCGLSDRDVEDLSFEAWVRDLETVVDAMGLERFPLLGLSQGCAVAIAYAVRHPERVTQLVLYGGFAEGLITRARTPRELEEDTTVMRQPSRSAGGTTTPRSACSSPRDSFPRARPSRWRWFSELQRIRRPRRRQPSGCARPRRRSTSPSSRRRCARRPSCCTRPAMPSRRSSRGGKLAALIPGRAFRPAREARTTSCSRTSRRGRASSTRCAASSPKRRRRRGLRRASG